jgi:molybdopterin molybdotransferase
VLAEPIRADRNFPPFNRVTMDGIAIQYDYYQKGARQFHIENTQAAGMPQKKLRDNQNAMEVMTGAVLPEGADTVIRYEDIELREGLARLKTDAIERGQNIHYQGEDAKQNELLLEPGVVISPAEVSLIASTGKSSVKVLALPPVAIVSTGDELVEIDETPLPWQVRRSNSYAVQSALMEMNLRCDVYHIRDDQQELFNQLNHIFKKHSIVILSGGVSKGKFDFVPQALEALGIKKLFHQVNQRPGKPFWFGKSENHIVFALPGNPVSTYLCFYRYVKPWLKKCLGLNLTHSQAILAADFTFKPALTYFLQVKVSNEQGKLMAYPDAGGGSGDFVNLKEVTGFLELPAERVEFKAGEVYSYYAFRQ